MKPPSSIYGSRCGLALEALFSLGTGVHSVGEVLSFLATTDSSENVATVTRLLSDLAAGGYVQCHRPKLNQSGTWQLTVKGYSAAESGQAVLPKRLSVHSSARHGRST